MEGEREGGAGACLCSRAPVAEEEEKKRERGRCGDEATTLFPPIPPQLNPSNYPLVCFSDDRHCLLPVVFVVFDRRQNEQQPVQGGQRVNR